MDPFQITFGTHRVRAIIADTYRADQVKRVAKGAAPWLMLRSSGAKRTVRVSANGAERGI